MSAGRKISGFVVVVVVEAYCIFSTFGQLTDFGLSKVGLINSTDDLSGPAVSGTTIFEDDQPQLSASEKQQERRKKRSAVGTPDYLAPEILLGTGHGLSSLSFTLYPEYRNLPDLYEVSNVIFN